MEKNLKKIKDYLAIIFQSSASNQIRLQKEEVVRFSSYVQLKKYQKHLRKLASRIFLALIFLMVGILISPAIFTPEEKVEIFIPNGRGDILISNVSNTEASVVFRTVDSANKNKPIATVSLVEIFEDAELSKLLKKTKVQDYAVTHIVPLSDLIEGNVYYLRISASESRAMEEAKTVSTWGDNEPLVLYVIDNVISRCPILDPVGEVNNSFQDNLTQDIEKVNSAPLENNNLFFSETKDSELVSNSLQISAVQNENYLHGKKKVQTIISWETNIPATSSLVYREKEKGEEKEIEISSEKVKKHAAVLTSLEPGTVYYFKVKSQDEETTVISDEYSLCTPYPRDNVLEMVGNNFKALVEQIGF